MSVCHVFCKGYLYLTLTLSHVDQSHRGGERDWSEDGFLCPASFLCLNGRPVSATQEGYRGGVA